MSLAVDFSAKAFSIAYSARTAGTQRAAGQALLTDSASELRAGDTATISEPARRRASEPAENFKDRIIASARLDPKAGEKYVDDYTSTTNVGPLVDIGAGFSTIRLSSTGELWTPEKQEKYEKASELVIQARREIFAAEKNKGSAPAEIIEKLFAYNDALPQWYKDGMNWS